MQEIAKHCEVIEAENEIIVFDKFHNAIYLKDEEILCLFLQLQEYVKKNNLTINIKS